MFTNKVHNAIGELEVSESKPKLVYATTQKHPDDPVELAFAVTDPQTGSEKIVKCENLDSHILFAATEEGERWLNQQPKSQGSVRNIRRSA